MQYRAFGRTDLKISEVGFGAWAIGGQSYGAVDRGESLRALALAEELGCNFVDTALVYGDSEEVVGEFLTGRRSRWVVATKYSGQDQGMTATLEEQLRRLKTDAVDLYQIHWAPGKKDHHLYDELYRLKQSGKARYVGVSLYSKVDIDYVLKCTQIDGLQLAFSLLDPNPFLDCRERIREAGLGMIIRSCLKYGFLAGKFKPDTVFADPHDQRGRWTSRKVADTVEAVEQFRFLEQECGSLVVAAARYPLTFPEVSTVILGMKSVAQAQVDCGDVPGGTLSDQCLSQVREIQRKLVRRSVCVRVAMAIRNLFQRH